MATITLKGNDVNTYAGLPAIGTQAPDFSLKGADLSNTKLSVLKGEKVVLNIFPSIDTPVCAMSVRKFNEEAAKKSGVKVLCISADLPFAHARFCGAEGLEDVISLSTIGNTDFGKDYGVEMVDGPLQGMMSRAIVILDEKGVVTYTEQVPEITQEPDYDKALSNI